jgi:hypothetical protein
VHKEKPLQDQRPIQGSDNPTITQNTYNGYSGKIPTKAFMSLEQALFGMKYGCASLTLFIKDGQLQYVKINKEHTETVNE